MHKPVSDDYLVYEGRQSIALLAWHMYQQASNHEGGGARQGRVVRGVLARDEVTGWWYECGG